MGTRSGDIDPSLLQHLMHKTGMSIDEMIKSLNNKSGLLGISGISPDMRDLKFNPDKRAQLARKIFINRIVRYVGSYLVEMGGIDAIVFTAGVGEHDVGVRKGVMDALKFISKPDSKVKAMIVPTNEELMIAREVIRLAK